MSRNFRVPLHSVHFPERIEGVHMGRVSMGEHPRTALQRRHRPRLAVPAKPEPECRAEEIAQLKARLAELEVGQKEGD